MPKIPKGPLPTRNAPKKSGYSVVKTGVTKGRGIRTGPGVRKGKRAPKRMTGI